MKNPVLLFPAWESLPEANDPGDTVAANRLALVRRLLDPHRAAPVIVTSLPALLQPVPSRQSIQKATRVLKSGDELSLDEFSSWLMARGFERVTAVEMPGEFSIRGGIVDIFPASESDPIRIELFGDEIESIRSFDAETQRRLEDLPSLSLTVTAESKSEATSNQKSAPAKNPFGEDAESLLDSLPASSIVVLSDLQQVISEGRM